MTKAKYEELKAEGFFEPVTSYHHRYDEDTGKRSIEFSDGITIDLSEYSSVEIKELLAHAKDGEVAMLDYHFYRGSQ